MLQLLHISDIHLNTGFSSKNENVRATLKTALLEALDDAFTYVIENDLEGIIIAGDFFDHDQISFALEHFVVNRFKNLLDDKRHIFYVTGNHDPMRTNAFLSLYQDHPYFHLFENDVVQHIHLISNRGIPYNVIACGHKTKNEKRNLIKTYPQKVGDEIWIGIGHASIPSAITIKDKESYMAAPLADIEHLNYNYFALGHIHIRQQLSKNIAYSGNIQGLNIKETGEKGGYLVELTPNSTEIKAVNFQHIRWEQIEVSLSSDVKTLSELQNQIVESITLRCNSIPMAAKQLIFRVYLIGKSSLASALKQSENIAFLIHAIKEKMGLLDVEIKTSQLTNAFEIEQFMREKTLLAYLLKMIQDETLEEALVQRLLELPVFNKKSTSKDVRDQLVQKKSLLLEELIERMVNTNDENK